MSPRWRVIIWLIGRAKAWTVQTWAGRQALLLAARLAPRPNRPPSARRQRLADWWWQVSGRIADALRRSGGSDRGV